MSEITLQINLSPSDVTYAGVTVPALVKAHRESVKEVVAVVDLCRPQKTKIVNPDKRFPKEVFEKRVSALKELVQSLKANGHFDRVEFLEPGNEWHKLIIKRYLNNLVTATHDYGGCALSSYLAAFELINTRYLLHYDADMLLYQKAGYDWAVEGITKLKEFDNAYAATPRIAPPVSDLAKPTHFEWPEAEALKDGWRDDWFSTRCFLFDREKLFKVLPLLKGKLALKSIMLRLLNRGYPRSPEVMLSERLRCLGGWRFHLDNTNAWLLHPLDKGERFREYLPHIIRLIEEDKVPDEQRGYPDLKLLAWEPVIERVIS